MKLKLSLVLSLLFVGINGQANNDNCPYRNIGKSNVSRFDTTSNYYRFIASNPQPKAQVPYAPGAFKTRAHH
jgi:hypothetical protein